MPLLEFLTDRIEPLRRLTFGEAGLRERQDIQRLLRAQIDVLSPDLLVVAEEFGDWQDSKRRIDLLAVDRDANLVVIELKRTEDGGHMELQAVRYAAMVAAMTWRNAVRAFADFRASLGLDPDAAEATLLDFLGWSEPQEAAFAQDVRIVLVSGDFHPEVTTTVMWLNQRGLDIQCIRLALYELDGRHLVDLQPIIPLPEARDFQVKLREKARLEQAERQTNRDYTRYDLTVGERTLEGLNKRQAIFQAVRGVCAAGISPRAIEEVLAWRKGHGVWRSAPGELTGEAFIQAVQAEQPERRFDPKRFFLADEEVLFAEGSTWCFSNQWGQDTSRALEDLARAFPQAGLQCVEVRTVTS